ncbi:hypothetical protein HMPREF2738_03211 [Clostridiales bacterium KLE1615]|nr:hypothetical protein HMPREF2738_03211 [Clostridiales bacterium KLE1615]
MCKKHSWSDIFFCKKKIYAQFNQPKEKSNTENYEKNMINK